MKNISALINKTILLVSILIIHIPIFSDKKAKLGEEEIKKSGTYIFENRSYKKASKSVLQDNYEIGKKLSELLKKNNGKSIQFRNFSVKRILPEKKGLFGADIITPNKNSEYGHINSLIRIIASYLENTFGYSEENSYLLSKYIIYYNAYHRKNESYVKSKYSEKLTSSLEPNKIGIASNYKKWSGESQIIIPLIIIGSGNLTGIPTDEIEKEANKYATSTEKEKFQKLKKQLEDDLKKDYTPASNSNNENENEKKITDNLNDGKTSNSDSSSNKTSNPENSNSKDERLAIWNNKKTNNKNSNYDETSNSLKKENEELKKDKNQLNKDLSDSKKDKEVLKIEYKRLNKVNSILKDQNDELKKDKNNLENKNLELKTTIAEKEKREYEQNENSRNVMDGKIVFLRVLSRFPSGSNFNNEIYLIDPDKDDAVVKSEYRNICSKKFEEFGHFVLLLGCDKKVFKLVLLNLRKELKKEFESEVSVYKDTPLIIDKNRNVLFAFEEDEYDHSVYLSKFDKSLKRLAKSNVPIHPDSRVTAFKNKIYVTSNNINGNSPDILVFNKDTMQLFKRFEPETGTK